MNPPPANPFTHRKMIDSEEAFSGRHRELANILARVRNGNSVSVTGERRIGKSSLLFHLFLTGNRRLDDLSRQHFRLAYLDLLDARTRTPEDFAKQVLDRFDLPGADAGRLQTNPLAALADALETHKGQPLPQPVLAGFSQGGAARLPSAAAPRLILLLDEFEEITHHKDLFTDQFLEALRSLCNGGLLTLVVVSKHSLKELTDRGDLTSPFWNIFTSQPLGEFVQDSSLNEVADFLRRWDEFSPTAAERTLLQHWRFRHPLKLQVVSFWVLQNRELALPMRKLKQEIENEMMSYFRSNTEKMSRWGKRNAPKLPGAISAMTKWVGEQVGNLGQIFKHLNGG
ncbi:MAG: ATP-binding protein [Bacteroidota bacterium]